MANEFVRNMLIEQRKRLSASVLSYCEQHVYKSLEPRQQRDLREKVLTAVGAYHDVCLDMLKATVNDGSIPNEDLIQAIADLHTDVRAINGR